MRMNATRMVSVGAGAIAVPSVENRRLLVAAGRQPGRRFASSPAPTRAARL